jgi:hypothetical protein
MLNLKDRFKEDLDFDVALYELGVILGFWPDNDADFSNFQKYKGVFWSNNKLGNHLYVILSELVKLGVLVKNEDGKFRANPDFSPEKVAEDT